MITVKQTERTASDIGKWFVKNGFDTPSANLEGNIKLQKMLFFSWLIHFHKFGKSLFKENFLAYDNGPVVEEVRVAYRDNYVSLKSEDFSDFSTEEAESLQLTARIFGDSDTKTLVELSHNSPAWKKYHARSIQFSDFKEKTIIPKEELEEELLMIQTVLYVHENMLESEDEIN